jgi:hypothetical protein
MVGASFYFNVGSLNYNTNVLMASQPGQPDTLKPAGELVVGDKLKAIDFGSEYTDLRTAVFPEDIDMTNVVETTITSISTTEESSYIYVDGDLFSKSHWILAKKDGVASFIKSDAIDSTYQRYSPETNSWVDIEIVEEVELAMSKVSINCEPYDNFFTKKMLVFDAPDLPTE